MNKFIKTSLVALGISLTQASFAADVASSQPQITACPGHFFSVSLPANAKQCQLFDAETPASMVFFSPDKKESMIEHFQSALPSLKVSSTFNDYTLLMGEQDTVRIIVSSDGNGSQIDVLILANTDLAKTS